MNNIMVDLETLGTCPGCAILSIGAVAFDPGSNRIDGDGFYVVVNTADCKDNYLHEDEETRKWWDDQKPEAKAVIALAEDPAMSFPLADALNRFNDYIRRFGGYNAKVWGNGADFDNSILAVAYRMADVKPVWAPFNGRCYRTLKNMLPGPKLARVGTYHNALDDARSQAMHMQALIAHSGKGIMVL